jgi:hypothetical protein
MPGIIKCRNSANTRHYWVLAFLIFSCVIEMVAPSILILYKLDIVCLCIQHNSFTMARVRRRPARLSVDEVLQQVFADSDSELDLDNDVSIGGDPGDADSDWEYDLDDGNSDVELRLDWCA